MYVFCQPHTYECSTDLLAAVMGSHDVVQVLKGYRLGTTQSRGDVQVKGTPRGDSLGSFRSTNYNGSTSFWHPTVLSDQQLLQEGHDMSGTSSDGAKAKTTAGGKSGGLRRLLKNMRDRWPKRRLPRKKKVDLLISAFGVGRKTLSICRRMKYVNFDENDGSTGVSCGTFPPSGGKYLCTTDIASM